MTIITREDPTDLFVRPMRPMRPVHRSGSHASVRRRPQTRRPAGAPLHHHGTGVLMSRASNRRRPVTPMTTVVLALVAAAITVWLGVVAQVGATAPSPAAVPGQLAVVEVQMGESLEQLAQRVAPDAPVGAVVDEIRDLNKLDAAAAVDAGKTLIAPVG